MQGRCQEKLIFRRAEDREEFLLPLRYKVYINSLLKALSNHCYAISVNSVSLPSLSFADDISLLALYSSFLETLMNICRKYGINWRYEFNSRPYRPKRCYCGWEPIHVTDWLSGKILSRRRVPTSFPQWPPRPL